jgi:hypothetical protein
MPSLLSDQLAIELRQTVAAEHARNKSAGRPMPAAYSPPRIVPLAVILNDDLAAATLLEPSSAMATLCAWDIETEIYTQLDSDSNVKVWNHSARQSKTNTVGLALPCNGHLWFLGDCDAWDDRPAPPGGV